MIEREVVSQPVVAPRPRPEPAPRRLERSRQSVLELQRSAGNQAVARSLGARTLARDFTKTADGLRAAGAESGAMSYRYLLTELTRYTRIGDDPSAKAEKLRDIRQYADLFLEHVKRNGNEAQAVVTYVTEISTEATAELNALTNAGAPGEIGEAAFPSPGKYTFEWWFNYIFAEAYRLKPGDAKVKEAFAWAKKYHAFRFQGVETRNAPPNTLGLTYRFDDDSEKLRVLQALMAIGFVSVKETDPQEFVNLRDSHYEPQSANGGAYQAFLPDLKTTGLVYRSDSRKPKHEASKPDEASIERHGGSKPRTRQTHNDNQVLKEMNMLAPWNPMKDKDLRESLLVRLGKQDNDLNAVVSIAVDPRDAVKFPLPGSDKADGSKVSGGTDFAHLYVIYVPLDSKVLDTSHVVDKMTKERTGHGVSTFGRGELGSAGINYDQHLIHIVTERFWDDNPGPGQVAYVIGKVVQVEKLQEDKWGALPKETQDGLKQVLEAIGDSGPMKWITHGEPEAGNARHREMEVMANQDRALILYPEHGGEMAWPDYTIKVTGAADATDADVTVSAGQTMGKRRDGRDFYFDWLGYPETQPLTVKANVHYGNESRSAPAHTTKYRPPRNVATFTAPAMNAAINGTTQVKIRCNKPGIERVELRADQPCTAPLVGRQGDEWLFDFTPDPGVAGKVSLRAVAISKGGGEMMAASRYVNVN